MDPFAPRPDAGIDYWFWKFHVGDLAFLVDVIVRRDKGVAANRVSYWLRGSGRVVEDGVTTWTADPDRLDVGQTQLRPNRSVGGAGDVQWDLRWTTGNAFVSPMGGLAARVEPFDTAILIWPEARFDGSVQVGTERFEVTDVPGTFYHYWGRRLMDRWVWISATHFEGEPERRLEAIIGGRTRLFGRFPSPVPVSLLWTTDGERHEEVASAVNGILRARITEDGIHIDGQRLGGPRHRVVAKWGDIAPNDLGEGIIQTMHADLTLDGLRSVPGTVGLEVRGYPNPLQPELE